MPHKMRCPTCGHRHQIDDDRSGQKMMCVKCEEIFRCPPKESTVEPLGPGAGADEARGLKFLKRALGNPAAALDGALPGAASGLFAGVLGTALVGVFTGASVGEIIGTMLLGFVVGFGVGTTLGAVFGVWARRLRPDMRIEAGFRLLAGGAVIGSVVVGVAGGLRWLALGAAFGSVGALLWPLLCSQVETAQSPRKPGTSEEDFPSEDANSTDRRYYIDAEPLQSGD
jgi:hypothetical protein